MDEDLIKLEKKCESINRPVVPAINTSIVPMPPKDDSSTNMATTAWVMEQGHGGATTVTIRVWSGEEIQQGQQQQVQPEQQEEPEEE